MILTPTNKVREEIREALVGGTGCGIQDGQDESNWPCGTCTLDLLERLGVEEGEHNDPVDRANEVWRAILQIRDKDLTTKEKSDER